MKPEKKRVNPLRLLLGNPKWQFITIPLFAIFMSLIAVSIIILFIGKNPIQVFSSLMQGAGLLPRPNYSAYQSMLTTFFDTLDAYTPMLFAALAVALAFRCGLFNIGVSGQMLLSGFVATILVGYSALPAYIAKPLVILIGAVVGAAVGGIIGFLKHRFNIHEVVSSIMLNYLIQYVLAYFITTRYIDPVTRQSKNIADTARLTLQNVLIGDSKFNIPLCFLLAIGCAVALHIFITRTRFGYDLKAVGLNAKAAEYAGIRVGRSIVSTMTISGMLAGLAGVTYFLGYYSSIRPNTLVGLGFDSIAVAFVAGAHPIGILFSALLVTALDRGSTYMSSIVGVRQEIAALVTGMILLFSACGTYIRSRMERGPKKRKKAGG